ncbi:acetyl-CoA carboxylase biotin carboxyl carrier protein [Tumebacillus permanentifrigoris]|uniref:Biotin carboxyl carrier protein of acetyl-CoA carboxylase n=1 Tax=Tumebacillus permanentifrigoris TaxID=378543 RepID=A0A316D8V4_9BACL|nr:acetyl-CoA carboxylase biotin carboxyl carrier protein [Tumebacillus permanentifrigoris]PWK11505.1 acetyl-CoA carboxylase biotin carboxyl carrier protein [Tumebacillus permanentifrigoris]
MFKLNEIRELIRLLDETSISEFNYELDGAKLLIKKDAVGATVVTPQVIHAAPAPVAAPVAAPALVAAPAPTAAPVVEAPAAAAPVAKVEDKNLHKIVSPMVGTFYKAPAPDVDAYVKAGARVDEKSIVCIVEAMKLMNEIEADVKGEIVEVLVENGQLVEYGQPLFLVKLD